MSGSIGFVFGLFDHFMALSMCPWLSLGPAWRLSASFGWGSRGANLLAKPAQSLLNALRGKLFLSRLPREWVVDDQILRQEQLPLCDADQHCPAVTAV
jgi:hypothetical protein